MPTNRNVIDFKIHNLTEEQFQELKDTGQIDPNALYCTPDETVVKFEELGERINTASERIDTKQDVATAINYGHVTNCITEIPQDIKLELADGVLTLKAGSKVYVPNGSGVFDVIMIENDITRTEAGTERRLVFVEPNGAINSFGIDNCLSGSYDGRQYAMFYNTTDNTIKYTLNNGSTWSSIQSLPICIITVNNGKVLSIDQVFNGFGYIGSTVFALPGVKGLIPDGRNIDGSLKNEEMRTTSVVTTTLSWGSFTYGLYLGLNDSNVETISGGLETDCKYDRDKNINIVGGIGRRGIKVITMVTENNKITSFASKNAFHAVDYNDLTIVSPAGIVSAFAGKTAPSGWLICDGSAVSRTRYASLFAAIGTLYGAGDGSTTFNLPNLIDGRVPFGMPSNYVGQSTEGVLPNITGQFATSGTNQSGSGAIWYTQASTGAQGWSGTGASNGRWDFNANRSNSMYGGGWFEGRKVVPASVGMTYCIKY